MRSLEVRADFFELQEKQNGVKQNGAGVKLDLDEREQVKNEGPSCYVSLFYNMCSGIIFDNESHIFINSDCNHQQMCTSTIGNEGTLLPTTPCIYPI